MEAEWAQHPPVHHLVAAYLGHEPPPPAADEPDAADAGPASADVFMQAGMGAIPGPAAARNATNRTDAIAAFEYMFFGQVKDVTEL